MRYVDRSEIKVVTGASMGLLCAYALSTNKLNVFEGIYRNVNIKNKAELLYQVFFKKLLWREINELLSQKDNVDIPLAFPVCYIPLYNVRYFWIHRKYNPLWEQYFRAAINYPFLNILPSVLDHRFAIDGGAADNIPLYPLLKKGGEYLGPDENFDLILALHFDARYDYRKDFAPDIPILDIDLGICNNFKKNHYDFSTEYVEEMLEKGEIYGEKICKRIFTGDCSKEGLQKTFDEIFLEEHAARQKNISVDRFFSWLNLIGKTLRSDSKCNRRLY